MEARSYYVYILASRIGGTLYIGVTQRPHSPRRRTSAEIGKRLHEEIRSRQTDLLRAIRWPRKRDQARKAVEEVESKLENPVDWRAQSQLGRSVSGHRRCL